MDKIEVEIQNQQATYDEDYEKKRKDIEDHKLKLAETLNQVEEEVQKVRILRKKKLNFFFQNFLRIF